MKFKVKESPDVKSLSFLQAELSFFYLAFFTDFSSATFGNINTAWVS